MKVWIDAARELRAAGEELEVDPHDPYEWRFKPGTRLRMVTDKDVQRAMVFVWGGNDGTDPLHDELNGRSFGPKATERAARICESLAYDGTDGP